MAPSSFLFLTLATLCLFLSTVQARNSPVVIIPGLTESQLEAKINLTTVIHPWCEKHRDWHTVWYDELLLLPPDNECFLDNFQLLYNNQTRQSYPPEGVEVRPIGYGDLKGINYYDVSHDVAYWANITEPLIQNYSYRIGYDLFGAPYDWRYGPNRYVEYEYPQLVQLIEDAYSITKLPVVLMSVSMGGTYTALFLNLQSHEWKTKYIRGWVSLSGVFSGSSEATAQLVTNDPTGRFKLVRNVDAVSKGFGSIAWLMPTTVAFSPDRIFAQTQTANYTIQNFTKLFEEANETLAGDQYKDSLPYSAFTPPEVEVFCVWGYNLSTPNIIQILDTTFMNYTATMGNGDTIVLAESLSVCSNEVWGKEQNETVHTIPQANVPHAGQFEDPQGVQEIIDIIINQLSPRPL